MTFQNKVAVITGGAHGIGNVFQQAYNMMDTMIAGRFFGEEAIAAIGTTAI